MSSQTDRSTSEVPSGTVRLKNAGAGDGVLRFALREAAEWLVDAGYPFDFTLTDEPPPPAFLLAIIDAVHADRSGTLHGRDLDWQTCAEWVASEARWRSDNGCPWCYQADTECGRPECLAHGGMLHPNKAPASGEKRS